MNTKEELIMENLPQSPITPSLTEHIKEVYLIKIIQETLTLKYLSTFLSHHLVSIYDLLRNYDPRVKSLDH
jgi:hypothetical protein